MKAISGGWAKKNIFSIASWEKWLHPSLINPASL
jgi:hypothetical protein